MDTKTDAINQTHSCQCSGLFGSVYNIRLVTRYVGSGIKGVESGITIGWDLGSQPRDQGSQAMGSGSAFYEGSGIRLYYFCGIRNQNLSSF